MRLGPHLALETPPANPLFSFVRIDFGIGKPTIRLDEKTMSSLYPHKRPASSSSARTVRRPCKSALGLFYSLFPIPYSLFPIPYSLLPIPYSLLPTPYIVFT